MNGPASAHTSYRRISPTWHMITTQHGVFFGYSAIQVYEKADAARRQNIITDAIKLNVRPLLQRQRMAARGVM